MVIITNFSNTRLFEGFYPNVSKPLFFTKGDKCNYHSPKWGKLRRTEPNYLLKDIQQISSRDGNTNQFS